MEITVKSRSRRTQKRGSTLFRRELGPFVVAAEKTRMAMIFTDAKADGHPIIFANASFLALTGYDREEVLGKQFNSLLAVGIDGDALATVEAEFASNSEHRARDPLPAQGRQRVLGVDLHQPGLRRAAARWFSISSRSSTSPGTSRTMPGAG